MSSTPLEIALDAIRRGWAPVPVVWRGKKPTSNNWEKLRITAEDAPKYFNGTKLNVGGLCGEPSGGKVDVDLDVPEALIAWSFYAPPTDCIFGRASKPRSHWIYTCPTVTSIEKIVDPERTKVTLLELRSTGGQTVLPGSTHQSGDVVEWHDPGDPADVQEPILRKAFWRAAAATILARSWPEPGGQHEAQLRLAGLLTRSAWPEAEVSRFLEAVCAAAPNCAIDKAKRKATAKDAADRLAADRTLYGWPKFVEVFGDKIARRVAELLGLDTKRTGATTRQTTTAAGGVHALSDLQLDIARIVKRGSDRGEFELHLADGRTINLGDAKLLFNFREAQAAIADGGKRTLFSYEFKKTWEDYANLIIQNADVVDVPTELEQWAEWTRDYIHAAVGANRALNLCWTNLDAIKPSANLGPHEPRAIDYGNGSYAVLSSGIASWLHWHVHVQATAKLVALRLSKLGFVSKEVSATYDPEVDGFHAPKDMDKRRRVAAFVGRLP